MNTYLVHLTGQKRATEEKIQAETALEARQQLATKLGADIKAVASWNLSFSKKAGGRLSF